MASYPEPLPVHLRAWARCQPVNAQLVERRRLSRLRRRRV